MVRLNLGFNGDRTEPFVVVAFRRTVEVDRYTATYSFCWLLSGVGKPK